MAKAGGEATKWIRYSQAKALASEYLGDPEFVERELRKGLAAGEIPWQCVRFEAPQQYSGPGRGDSKFWTVDPDILIDSSAGFLIVRTLGDGIRTEGDSATRIEGAAAYGVELGRNALVRRKLLPPDDVGGDAVLAKVYAPRVARDLKRAGKLDQVTKKIDLANLILTAGVATGGDKVGADYIRDNLEGWDLWPTSKIKI